MPAPDFIRDLVQRFQSQSAGYHKASYNETELRRDFLDPFFAALGWDMTNTGGGSEKYREVIHEASVEVEGQAKAADYAFRMGGNNVFFVEAKKPAVNIAASAEAAFQLRSYGWSGKLPISLLTDFEQLAVYDCRDKPKHGEAAHLGRVSLYHYTEYIDKWDELYSRFSREAVFTGKFDQFAGGTKGKKGTTDVDDAFLEMLEGWRELLARNIALRNPGLSVRDLNFAVQTTIDRIIFLRICEDRGIEAEDALRRATDGKDIYQDLLVLFKTADRKYNSGLFHFSAEKGESSPADTLTPTLKIDDKVLKEILAGLYHPSPYAFKYIPADILGQVYERFLGKVIRLTNAHQAKVEEKPEVRKAGGVYYTPTYIVEYIVKNTLGELLQGETPETQQARPLRVLDPACGSGSFLLGAYQYLLDWYLEWYAGHEPARWTRGKSPAVVESQAGWQLTMEKKKDILLAHIFGVDIDQQAVEVTKLSLLLKVVENPGQLSFLDERILPDLGENVKCGNSLIGMDYYTGRQMPMFGDAELERVNPFDWQDAFRKVFAQGGFDAVIGNPPYGALVTAAESKYYREKYEVKDIDTYALFIELAIKKLKINGKVSMIVPTGWYSGTTFTILRKYFACWTNPEIFVNLPYDIFGAWVDTTIYVATKIDRKLKWPRLEMTRTRIITFPKRFKIQSVNDFDLDESTIDICDWFEKGGDEFLTYADMNSMKIMRKVESSSKPLSDLADVQRGVTPFHLDEEPKFKTSKCAFNGTVRRYVFEKGEEKFIRYDETLAEFKPERYFSGERLLLRELISRQFRLQAVLVKDDFITNKSMQSILQKVGAPNLNYLLGFLNSKLLSWYFLNKSNIAQRDDFPKIVLKETRSLPIRTIDFNDPADVKRHERMVALVESMLGLHKRLAAAGSPQEKELLQRQIAYTDREIDALVYELYGLTDEEIRIVEGA